MEETTLWALVLTQALLLGAVGLVGAWAAGRLGTAPVAGAVVAGLLLGPSLVGTLAPQTYRALFVGGYEEYRALQEYREDAEDDLERLEGTGVTQDAIDGHVAVMERDIARLEAELAEAEQEGPQQAATGVVAMAGIVFVMLAATRGVAKLERWRPRLAPALLLASGSGALAGVTGAVLVGVLAWFGRLEAPTPWVAGVAMACAAGATPIPSVFLQRPRGHELDGPLLQMAAWFLTLGLLAAVAVLVAVETRAEAVADLGAELGAGGYVAAVVGVLMLIVVVLAAARLIDIASDLFIAPTSDGARMPPALTGFVVTLCLLLGLMIVGPTLAAVALAAYVAATALRRSRHAYASVGALVDRAAQGFFAPMLLALAGLHVHLLTDFDWLLLLVLLVAIGDGKVLGAMLAGRGVGYTWRMGLKTGAAMIGGTATPIVIALLLHLGGVMDGRAYTAVVLAVVICSLLAMTAMKVADEAFAEDV